MTDNRRRKTVPLQQLLNEADELFRTRTMAHPETDRKLDEEQLEEFLESAEKEIRLRSELLDRECVQVGKTLFSVRQRLPRADFRSWVQKSCPFCYKTAQNYINLFRVTLDRPELLCLKKSVIYLIGSRNFPEALLEYISENLVGIYELGMEDVLKLQTDYLNGDIDLEDDSFTKHLVKKEKDEMHQLCEADWRRTITKLENERKRYEKRITSQKKIGAASYSNKFKRMWETTISILDRAISDIHSLIRDGVVEDTKKTRAPKAVKSRQPGPLWPDPPDHVFEAIKKREFEQLAPEDLTPWNPRDDAASRNIP